MSGRGRRKPVRPTPNRAHPLWRGCLFAVASGWNKGWRENDGATTFEDQTRQRGILQGSRPGTHKVIDAGRALADGVSGDTINWAAPLGRYDTLTNRGFTIAMLTRPDNADPGSDAIFFAKRANTSGGTSGWHLGIQSGSNVWECEYSDGFEVSLQGTTAASNSRTDLVACTFDRAALGGLMKIYINGILENTRNTTTAVGNTTQPIRLFGGSTASGEGSNTMAAFWDRPQPATAIARLHTDPYIMWKPLNKDFMFGPGALESTYNTYFNVF